jgi:cell wall-associated NlpC family hydrolase
MTPRDLALQVALSNLGQPYVWGGDDPVAGFDCSGLVVEALKACGVLPRDGDWSAHTLLHGAFQGRPRVRTLPALERGMLVFWPRDDGVIRHVEMVYTPLHNGAVITIGASGGGSKTTDREAAIRANAYVKLRPVAPGWSVAVDPF